MQFQPSPQNRSKWELSEGDRKALFGELVERFQRQEPELPLFKAWSVLAYFAGDNNLTDEMFGSLRQMEAALAALQSAASLRVVAQLDADRLCPLTFELDADCKKSDGLLGEQAIRGVSADRLVDLVRDEIGPTTEHLSVGFKAYYNGLAEIGENAVKHWLGDLAALPEGEIAWLSALICGGTLFSVGMERRLVYLLTEYAKRIRIAPATSSSNLIHTTRGLAQSPPPNRPAAVDTEKVARLARRIARTSESLAIALEGSSCSVLVKEFIRNYLVRHRTSRHLMVILSGHGSGAIGDFLPDDNPSSALSIPRLRATLEDATRLAGDQLAYDIRRIAELSATALVPDRPALEEVARQLPNVRLVLSPRKIDILGMDSCLMSMLEVCYEIRECAHYMIGSEGFIAGTGWPYQRLIETLVQFQEPDLHPPDSALVARQAALAFADKFVSYFRDYQPAGMSSHIAVVDLHELVNKGEDPCGFIKALRELADLLVEVLKPLRSDEELCEIPGTNPPGCSTGAPKHLAERRRVRDAVTLAHWYAQSFKWEQYVDLFDFFRQLKRFLDPKRGPKGWYDRLRKRCDEIIQYSMAGKGLILYSNFTGPEFQHAHGLSVYFPWSAEDFVPEYSELQFAQDTRWDDFLRVYLRVTRRVRRGEAENEGKDPVRLFTNEDPLEVKAGTSHSLRAVTSHTLRAGTTHSLRAGTSHVLRGKIVEVHAKNPPDGFFPPRLMVSRSSKNDPGLSKIVEIQNANQPSESSPGIQVLEKN